jgi:hypothetical protein
VITGGLAAAHWMLDEGEPRSDDGDLAGSTELQLVNERACRATVCGLRGVVAV